MKQLQNVADTNAFRKETYQMDKAKLRNRRLKNLDKGKTRSLGIVERLSMKYAGRVDGRKGLLRCNADGIWQSSALKQEVDSYEEFCAQQMAGLKVEEENEFKEMNILFDKVIPLRKKLFEARKRLSAAMGEEVNLAERKEGEENLTEAQVNARRNRERTEQLQPLRDAVEEYEKKLSATVDEIFVRLSQVKESFDSTVKIINRLQQRCQRRVDVYWRSAMRYMPELPALPSVIFSNVSEQAFFRHYENVAERAEKLRRELESELYGEAI